MDRGYSEVACSIEQTLVETRNSGSMGLGCPYHQGIGHLQARFSSDCSDGFHVVLSDGYDGDGQLSQHVAPLVALIEGGMDHEFGSAQRGDGQRFRRRKDALGVGMENVRRISESDEDTGVEDDHAGHSSFSD